MNKISIVVIAIVSLIGCTAQFNRFPYGNHIVIDKNDVRYFINDSLKLSAGLQPYIYSYDTNILLDRQSKQVLKAIGFDKKKDTLLYAGQFEMLILKNKNVDLQQFRIINLYDTILSVTPYDNWKVNFYRKTVSYKNLYIINDLIPFQKKYFQRIEYTVCDVIDPKKLDDDIYFAAIYKDIIKLTKETYRNILQEKIVEPKNVFTLFSDYFNGDTLFNYRAAHLAETNSQSYYKPEDNGLFGQMLATYYSFADDTHRADSAWISISTPKERKTLPPKTGSIDDLLKLTANQQIVMFNEAHHVPKHRLLVTNLLDTLYAQGFRYLGIEAFFADSTFLKKGFPSSQTGFYLSEPTFANLVRTAHKIGYKIFGYDDFEGDREYNQAKNIYEQTFKIDTNAKVLIYAGYAHIDTAWMAGKFRQISGIKPLTIDQTYGYFYNLGKNSTDSIYLIQPNENDNYIKGADLYLFNDLILPSGKTDINVPESIREFCTIVTVYDYAEFIELTNSKIIPLPISVCSPNNSSSVTANLNNGKYMVVFQDDYGTILYKQQLIIE